AQGNLFRLPREVDLQRHLVNGNVAEEDPGKQQAEDDKVEPKMFEFGGADDYQLQQAINFLEGRNVKKNDPNVVVAKAEKPADAKAGKPTAGKGKSDAAKSPQGEKKTPVNPPEPRTERYRITPDGVVPASQ